MYLVVYETKRSVHILGNNARIPFSDSISIYIIQWSRQLDSSCDSNTRRFRFIPLTELGQKHRESEMPLPLVTPTKTWKKHGHICSNRSVDHDAATIRASDKSEIHRQSKDTFIAKTADPSDETDARRELGEAKSTKNKQSMRQRHQAEG